MHRDKLDQDDMLLERGRDIDNNNVTEAADISVHMQYPTSSTISQDIAKGRDVKSKLTTNSQGLSSVQTRDHPTSSCHYGPRSLYCRYAYLKRSIISVRIRRDECYNQRYRWAKLLELYFPFHLILRSKYVDL